MSKLSISEVLNMLDNDFELDGGFSDLVDNDDFPTNNSETVPVNVYDLNALPTSFVEELESENQNMLYGV